MEEQMPGYLEGKHFTTYVPQIEALKREGKLAEAEHLLLKLVEATEADSVASNRGVAPAYYEELAKIYRKRKDYTSEIAVLERFAHKKHSPGAKPAQLLERLEKVKQLQAGYSE